MHLTTDFESSSLPTPATHEPGFTFQPVDKNGNPTNNPNERWYHPETGRLVQKGIKQALASLPTPTTMDAKATNNPEIIEKFLNQGKQTSLTYELLRSPTASQGEGGALGEDEARRRGNTVGIRDQAMDLAALNGQKITRAEMLPTPMTSDARHNNNEGSWNRKSPQIGTVVHATNWGKFEPAIRRWEKTIGRPAPAPTKPDGKDGAHRLSSAFTEWMMGLPDGWITDCGLSRNDELKACGNGVVPQQAELALRILLEGIEIERGGGK